MPKGSSFCSGPTSRRHTGGQYDRHMEDNPEQKNGNFILKCKYFNIKFDKATDYGSSGTKTRSQDQFTGKSRADAKRTKMRTIQKHRLTKSEKENHITVLIKRTITDFVGNESFISIIDHTIYQFESKFN